MKNNINIEYIELLPDGKRRTNKGKLVINTNKHLRRVLFKYCNSIAYIAKLGKYNRSDPMTIQLKGSDISNYCKPFTLDKKGRIRPLADYGLCHNWTYRELSELRTKGLTKGDINTIEVVIGGGAGDAGTMAESVMLNIISSVFIWALSSLLKCTIPKIDKIYYVKKYRNNISEQLITEIINKRDEWHISDIKGLFYYDDNESATALMARNYSQTTTGIWRKSQKHHNSKTARIRAHQN